MRTGLLAIALFAVADAAVAEEIPSPPAELVHEGETHRLVTGDDLRTMLAGHGVVWRKCDLSSRCTDKFAADGRGFVRYGDRLPEEEGTYSVIGDHYCMTLYPERPYAYTDCKALLRSASGQIVEITSWNGRWGSPVIVDVRALAEFH